MNKIFCREFKFYTKYKKYLYVYGKVKYKKK